jgi:hypothetical protein
MPTVADHVLDFDDSFYINAGISRLHQKENLQPDDVKEGDIVFVKTDYVYHGQFINILRLIKNKFTLITAGSSYNVSYGHPSYLDILNSDKVKYWFCTNPPNIDHPKLIAMPIGFEEKEREGGDQEVIKKHWDKKLRWENKINKLYLSYHTLGNNPSRDKNINYLSSLSFVHIEKNKLPFDKYLDEVGKYKYTICLEGSGFDTHRNYESLLVGSIPIMIDSSIRRVYKDWRLPSIFVGEWTDICPNFNLDKHDELNKLSKNVADFLKISSHKEKILKHAL